MPTRYVALDTSSHFYCFKHKLDDDEVKIELTEEEIKQWREAEDAYMSAQDMLAIKYEDNK